MMPSIGRIVHYYGVEDGATRAYAAIITDVRDDNAHVDLCVFRPQPEVVLGCPRAARGADVSTLVGYWDWPVRIGEPAP